MKFPAEAFGRRDAKAPSRRGGEVVRGIGREAGVANVDERFEETPALFAVSFAASSVV